MSHKIKQADLLRAVRIAKVKGVLRVLPDGHHTTQSLWARIAAQAANLGLMKLRGRLGSSLLYEATDQGCAALKPKRNTP